jgi:flagellar biosynthesis protein FlhA
MQLDSPDQPEDPNLLELGWDDAGQVDVISLELGYGLIPMVDADTGGRLLNRLKGIRKKLSAEMGFLLPSIRIRDNLDSAPDAYQIVINGSVRGVGVIANGKEMAINPGNVLSEIPGEPGKDPAFGLDAVWIDPSEREYAQAVGYTVVDASTVIATHLNSVIKDNADELMTYDVAQQLIDKIAETSPKLVEDFIPEKLTLGTVVRVLQNLLRERVPLRDMRTILETLSEESSRTQDAGQLCALVRPKLARLIVQDIIDPDETLAVMTLDPTLEQLLTDLVSRANSYDEIALEPALAESFFASIRSTIEELEQQDLPAVLVVSPMLRPWLARLLRRSTKDLTVLCYTEIPDDQPISVVSSIEVNEREDEQS